jgi:hypothetical protein
MTHIKAALFTIFSFGLAFATFAMLIANGMASFDCVGEHGTCEAAEIRNALLIVAGALALWAGGFWLLLRKWGKD